MRETCVCVHEMHVRICANQRRLTPTRAWWTSAAVYIALVSRQRVACWKCCLHEVQELMQQPRQQLATVWLFYYTPQARLPVPWHFSHVLAQL